MFRSQSNHHEQRIRLSWVREHGMPACGMMIVHVAGHTVLSCECQQIFPRKYVKGGLPAPMLAANTSLKQLSAYGLHPGVANITAKAEPSAM